MATRRSNEPRRGQTPAAVGAAESAETTAKEPSPSTRTRKRAQPKQTAVPPPGVTVSADVRRGMIAEAAYLRAERRGFAPGHEEEDWLAAETEVDVQLASGQVWGGPQ
jgi:Protein of unknown function (DUF2934)